ncbi:MAG: hypothetical protein ACLR0U_00875 [Enterocloster clostridioformis]
MDFLCLTHQSPEYINLNEVFYSGAGLEQSPLTEEERDMYLKTVGQPELYTDLVRLSTEQMDGFLTEKTGLSLDRMKSGLEWIYLAPFDRYYSEHGDTNMRSFFCPGGEVDGGIYRYGCLSDGYSQFNLEHCNPEKGILSGISFCPMKSYGIILASIRRMPSPPRQRLCITSYRLDKRGG